MKILVIKTSSLGDVIHALPAVNLLLKKYPDAEIDWLIKPGFKDMLKFCNNIDRIIFFDSKRFSNPLSTISYTLELRNELREVDYDIVIDFQGLARTGIFTGLAKGRLKVGFRHPRESLAALFYNKKVDVEFRHAIDRNLDLVKGVVGQIDDSDLVLPIAKDFADGAKKILNDNKVDLQKKTIALVPGARWESKCFPVDVFMNIASCVNSKIDANFLLIGGPDEVALGEKMEEFAEVSNMNVINLINKTKIGEMAEILRLCDFVVCNDSGPMHIAAAMGTKLAALFGPTIPERTGPYGKNSKVFSRKKLNCLGCLKRQCPKIPDIACHEVDSTAIAEYIIENITN